LKFSGASKTYLYGFRPVQSMCHAVWPQVLLKTISAEPLSPPVPARLDLTGIGANAITVKRNGPRQCDAHHVLSMKVAARAQRSAPGYRLREVVTAAARAGDTAMLP
jgi:hypothetical protein